MKKLIVTFVILFSAFTSVFAANECDNTTAIKHGGIGAAVGAGAALVIPGFGPVVASGILAGMAVTTTHVAICAYEESQESKTTKHVKKLYNSTVKQAEVIYKDLTNKVDSFDIHEKKEKAIKAIDELINSISKKESV